MSRLQAHSKCIRFVKIIHLNRLNLVNFRKTDTFHSSLVLQFNKPRNQLVLVEPLT